MSARPALGELGNRVAVQLFKHVPWLGERWARHRFVQSRTIPWTVLRRPLAASALALVTTAGVHLRTDGPFDMDDPDGDPSVRVIPVDTPAAALTITHKYYDHSAADRDLNVVLPVDRARELVAAGRIRALAPRIYSLMGHIDGRHLSTLVDHTAPAIATALADDGADAVVLTPA